MISRAFSMVEELLNISKIYIIERHSEQWYDIIL